jgi:hypothetical protein
VLMNTLRVRLIDENIGNASVTKTLLIILAKYTTID